MYPQDMAPAPEMSPLIAHAYEHADVVGAREAVAAGREELMDVHPDMPHFISALTKRRLFDVSACGYFKIEKDRSLDVEGYGTVSFCRDETGYVVVIAKDGETVERPVDDLFPDLSEYHPQFDEPTGLFRKRIARTKMVNELSSIADHNKQSAQFWGAWLAGLRGADDVSDRHVAANAYINPDLKQLQSSTLTIIDGKVTTRQHTVRQKRKGVDAYIVGAHVDVWTGEPVRPYEFIALYEKRRNRRGVYLGGYFNDSEGYMDISEIIDTHNTSGYYRDSYSYVRDEVAQYDVGVPLPQWSTDDVDMELAIAHDRREVQSFLEKAVPAIEHAKTIALTIPHEQVHSILLALSGEDSARNDLYRILDCLEPLSKLKRPHSSIVLSPRQVDLLRDALIDIEVIRKEELLREDMEHYAALQKEYIELLEAWGEGPEVMKILQNFREQQRAWSEYKWQLRRWLDNKASGRGPAEVVRAPRRQWLLAKLDTLYQQTKGRWQPVPTMSQS